MLYDVINENEKTVKENYKLHIYYKETKGTQLKGNIQRKEYFNTFEEMHARYRELFVYNDFALNPTAWKKENGHWTRLLNY